MIIFKMKIFTILKNYIYSKIIFIKVIYWGKHGKYKYKNKIVLKNPFPWQRFFNWEKDYIPLKNNKHVGSLIHDFTHQAFIIQKLSKSFVSWKQKTS
jgi:hypothetical protein